ncbi:MAG TPA: alpha/beta fold hydrolase [Candidatus Dormibacteraeota bacterium]|nr:alpha/beta fold hydrolase [Candidatus Dormibacteraeota bacterium]
MSYRRFEFDGGTIEYVLDGPEEARDLLVFHVGTPAAAVRWTGLVDAAAGAGMRVASYSRGGYGTSARREGRSVADEAAITAALADHLGHPRFFVLGWSGGGAVALACAALLPDRVRACMSLAGIAPRTESGAAWKTFHSPEQDKEWEDLAKGDMATLLPDFEGAVGFFSHVTVRKLRVIGGPGDERGRRYDVEANVDRDLVRSMRRAVLHGYSGFLDDNLAQVRDWGFRVADIRVPVVVRQGALDRLVQIEQGRWLAATIPGARGVFLDDAGHGSIALPWSEVVRDLVSAAR